MVDNIKYPLIEGEDLSVTDINDKVNVKGHKPELGTITVRNKRVVSASMGIGGYMVIYDGLKARATGSKTDEIKDSNITITSNTTTKSINLNYAVEDELGVKEVKLYMLNTNTNEYDELELSDNTALSGSYLKEGLEPNKEYTFKLEVKNTVNKVTLKVVTIETKNMQTPEIDYKDSTKAAIWTTSKILEVTYIPVEGTHLEYQINGHDDNNWQTLNNNEIEVTQNETVYVRISDGSNNTGSSSITITKIDTTEPVVTTGTITNTTKSIVIPFTATDSQSDIRSVECFYGENYENNGLIEDNECKINNVTSGNYNYKIKAYNNSLDASNNYLSTEVTGNTSTGTFGQVTISEDTSNYTVKKTVTLTGSTEGSRLQYSLGSGWIDYESPFEVNSNTTVYGRLYDGINASTQATLSITTIDTTPPTNEAPATVVDTNTITVTNHQEDLESDIVGLEYGISEEENGTYTWQANNVFTGREKNHTYYIKTRANNNARVNSNINTKIESLVREATTKEFTPPTVTVDNTNWALSHTFTATYTKGEITEPYYYIKSTVASTLKTNTTLKACTSLSGTTKTCSGAEVSQNGTLTANTWYQTTVTSLQVELSDNGSVYVAVSDGHNLLDTPTASTTKVDKIPPTVTAGSGSIEATTSTASVPISVVDNEIGTIGSVKCEYKLSTESNYVTTNATGTTSGCSFTGLTHNKIYNFRITAKDSLNNETLVANAYTGSFTTGNINSPTTALNITTNTTACSQSRTITVTGALAGTQLQYKIGDNGTWTDINSGGTFNTNQNTTIYAQLTDSTNSTTNAATLTLTSNGDTTPVTQTKPSVSDITTKGVTVTTGQTDACGIGTVYYAIKKDGESYGSWQTTNTFTNLDSGAKYYVKTKANDVAGNGEKESAEESFTTVNINTPTTALNITENTSACSKSKTMTVTGALSGTQLQYRIGSNGTWTDIANGGTFTLTQNNTIYARLYDGRNETTSTNYKTFTVSTYDVTPVGTTAPTTSNITINSVTVTNKQTDNCGLNTSTLQYGYSTSASSGYTWVNTSTITGLSEETTYYIKTRINDTAGNGLTESNYATITTLSDKKAANITYTNYGNTTAQTALDDLFKKTE